MEHLSGYQANGAPFRRHFQRTAFKFYERFENIKVISALISSIVVGECTWTSIRLKKIHLEY